MSNAIIPCVHCGADLDIAIVGGRPWVTQSGQAIEKCAVNRKRGEKGKLPLRIEECPMPAPPL